MPRHGIAGLAAGSSSEPRLDDGARIGVIGGGPAGSFFSYFALATAERLGLSLGVDLYEPRDYRRPAPHGCNMCGGIVSESLVQLLAAEGIRLPDRVIERGIDAYVLHTDVGSVRIRTPAHEMRIGAVYRGAGPRDSEGDPVRSFDGHLQDLAQQRGARIVSARAESVTWSEGRPVVRTRGGSDTDYDLLVFAVGINATTKNLLKDTEIPYAPPGSTKTFIREYRLGEKGVERAVGTAMHVFLLDIPRLEFAAIIPKGEYVTVCLLGDDIDKELVEAFLGSREVNAVLPDAAKMACHCSPRINVTPAVRPYADRLVFVGDCAVTRLYKDGIGAAYRTAKAAANAALFHGVSAESFERHYWPACRTIVTDNGIGKAIFSMSKLVQRSAWARRSLVRSVAREQRSTAEPRLSMMLWDLFSGSAPYRDILQRGVHPAFLLRFLGDLAVEAAPGRKEIGEGVVG